MFTIIEWSDSEDVRGDPEVITPRRHGGRAIGGRDGERKGDLSQEYKMIVGSGRTRESGGDKKTGVRGGEK